MKDTLNDSQPGIDRRFTTVEYLALIPDQEATPEEIEAIQLVEAEHPELTICRIHRYLGVNIIRLGAMVKDQPQAQLLQWFNYYPPSGHISGKTV